MKILSSEFCDKKLIPNINRNILGRFNDHIDKGEKVIIVSGGYSVYLEEFARRFGNVEVIACELRIKNNFYTGSIEGTDCLGIEKLQKLNNRINLEKYNLKDSSGYTDSLMDLPLMELFGSKYLVDIGQRKDWAEILGWVVIPK